MPETMTEIVRVRVSPRLKKRLVARAARLALRPADLIRFAIGVVAAGELSPQYQAQSDPKKGEVMQ